MERKLDSCDKQTLADALSVSLCSPAPPEGEPLAYRISLCELSKAFDIQKRECPVVWGSRQAAVNPDCKARHFLLGAQTCPACQGLPRWGSWRSNATPERAIFIFFQKTLAKAGGARYNMSRSTSLPLHCIE